MVVRPAKSKRNTGQTKAKRKSSRTAIAESSEKELRLRLLLSKRLRERQKAKKAQATREVNVTENKCRWVGEGAKNKYVRMVSVSCCNTDVHFIDGRHPSRWLAPAATTTARPRRPVTVPLARRPRDTIYGGCCALKLHIHADKQIHRVCTIHYNVL